MRNSLRLVAVAAALLILFLTAVSAGQQLPGVLEENSRHAEPTDQKATRNRDPQTLQPTVDDPGVITTNQSISPAGIQGIFQGRVFGVTFGSSSHDVYVETSARKGTRVYKFDWQSNKLLDKLVQENSDPGLQGLTFDPETQSILTTVAGKTGVALVSKGIGATQQRVTVLTKHEQKDPPYFLPLPDEIAGVALSPAGSNGTRYAVAALTFDDQAAILDYRAGAILAKVKTGIAPFGVIIDAQNTTAYVSNWGGRFPRAGDLTAATGPDPHADKIVVDSRGIASSGTVTRIDLKTATVTAEIEVGLHPTALALDNYHGRLYVSNSNSDTISVIDTGRNAIVDSISLEPFARRGAGVAPESLALSNDGRNLYVACAGINAIAVLTLKNGHMRLEGLIPTGWYPDAIALSPDGTYLGVTTLFGVGSGSSVRPAGVNGTWTCPNGLSQRCRYAGSTRGTVQIIPVPDSSKLRQYSLAVAENSHLRLESTARSANERPIERKAVPVPSRSGDPSPIKHIVYVIKENRTYDQFFGSLGKGNGDPSLESYADDVIPNHRRLAKEYVLLDNFYATGDSSGDGHQWVTQANETDYARLPGYGGRSYPGGGGNDPMAFARSGFIWNEVARVKKTFVDFGEFSSFTINGGSAGSTPQERRANFLKDFKNGSSFEGKFSAISPVASLGPYLVKDYPGWPLDVPDVARARVFINHLKQWEKGGEMPNLVMLTLPSDHTAGTTPGFSTPKACMADNDYALGMIVDAVSHSGFWGSTLILVVEDDSADGVDHVDGHRTVALAISPYIKRGSVDSTFYSQPSMLKTIELILGLRNMSLFDLIANDMGKSFQGKPDLTPYAVQVPRQSVYEVNPPLKALTGQKRADARASLKMNFTFPDVAPSDRLNRILWRDSRGSKFPYPKVTQAIFMPFWDDDDKREAGGDRR